MAEAKGGHLYSTCSILLGGVKGLFLKAAFWGELPASVNLSVVPATLWRIPRYVRCVGVVHLEQRWARPLYSSLDLLQVWKTEKLIFWLFKPRIIICLYGCNVLAQIFPATQDVRKNRKHQQRRIPSNDELLYDPEEDRRDQEWVDSQRRG